VADLKTYHIHFEGIVQGVGFRPFVYRYAVKHGLRGWVNNTNDGVHIHINADVLGADRFLKDLLEHMPPLAVITNYSMEEDDFTEYNSFEIIHSESRVKPKLLLTPDVAMCEDCKRELYDSEDRRYAYPFITCTNCGPRYSIITKLPYDRPNTTMAKFEMCDVCLEEYNNPMERRHYSQTNSCPDCAVEMQLYEQGKSTENFQNLDYITEQWQSGKIIAVKGIGGYLLTCDATNKNAVALLRDRKHRPTKPFALMYPDVESVRKDVFLSEVEEQELNSIHAPIVLLEIKPSPGNSPAVEEISHGLSRLGIMLPYTPLYDLLLQKFGKPIVATSGNITDSTIIFEDDKAVKELSRIADIILMNNREIVVPQDDGVVQFTKIHSRKITLRRSRGKAPAYINPVLKYPEETVLSTGSMLKSVFGLLNRKNIYISQYLGNTESYDAQLNYEKTWGHFQQLFDPQIDVVVTDLHPDYFSTRFGRELADKHHAEVWKVQHHKAHFYSVLGEHNLQDSRDKILGVIWDGTGLGEDGQIWGGEFFMYEQGKMERVDHLPEYDFFLADKMVREPRISALAMMHGLQEAESLLRPKFSETEWKVYGQLLKNGTDLKSTSMGRLFDAVSSVLLGYDIHTFEAEASMQLENVASQYYYAHRMSLADSYLKDKLPENIIMFILEEITGEMKSGTDKGRIAARFHLTLAGYIQRTARKYDIRKLAFSGGVFQNALMTDMVIEFMGGKYDLYFQKEFSPNDEGIPFGQIMYYLVEQKRKV